MRSRLGKQHKTRPLSLRASSIVLIAGRSARPPESPEAFHRAASPQQRRETGTGRVSRTRRRRPFLPLSHKKVRDPGGSMAEQAVHHCCLPVPHHGPGLTTSQLVSKQNGSLKRL